MVEIKESYHCERESQMNNMLRSEKIERILEQDNISYREVIRRKLTSKSCLCLFPCGVGSKSLIRYLKNMDIIPDFISDNSKEKLTESVEDIPCITVEKLWDKQQDDVTILVESLYYEEIKKELQEKGFTDIQRIYFGKEQGSDWVKDNGDDFRRYYSDLLNILEDEKSKDVVETIVSGWIQEDIADNYFSCIYDKNQYFDTTLVKLSREECFVDCGAYTGDTTEELLRRIPEFRGNIYQFELDPNIYADLNKNMQKYKDKLNIVSFPFGNAEKEMEIEIETGNRSSRISAKENSEGSIRAKVVALDDILKDKKVTFIKMDIEGSEWDALHGAKRIIREQKPKLAICLYHKPEDMFRVPLYIKELAPEYKIYIRHYTDMLWETVCYAW